MIIRRLNIRNFGKIKAQTVDLKEGLNIVSGPNESGKSTLHAFIKSMFYGIRRQRGRAAARDTYSRYEPWENAGCYEGSMYFESGGKTFRLVRDFQKNHVRESLVCESDGEQLSIEQGDLKMLLGHVSEAVFDNTVSIGQLKVQTDENLVTALRNYMANYQESSGGGVDVEAAVQKLRVKRRELEKQKKENRQELTLRQRELENHLEYLVKEREQMEVQIQEQSQLQQEEEHQEWQEQMAKAEAIEEKLLSGRRKKLGYLVGVVLLGLVITLLGLLFEMPVGITAAAAVCTLAAAVLWFFYMKKGTVVGRRARRLAKKQQEERTQAEGEKQTGQLTGQQQLEVMLEEKITEIANLRHTLQEVEELLEGAHPLDQEIQAVELAGGTIEKLAREQPSDLGEQLRKRTSQILAELTCGKYSGLHISENLQIGIDAREAYVTPDQLSRGTLEQIYFAFRMAASELLCQEEKLPILLDDVFVMYDEERLVKALRWLAKCGHQVLIFTCHKREEELLRKFQIPYHKVDLEETVC